MHLLYSEPQVNIKLGTCDRGGQNDWMFVRLPLRGVSSVDGKGGCKEIAPLGEAIDGKPIEGVLHLRCVTIAHKG